jgi:hypothetical protein
VPRWQWQHKVVGIKSVHGGGLWAVAQAHDNRVKALLGVVLPGFTKNLLQRNKKHLRTLVISLYFESCCSAAKTKKPHSPPVDSRHSADFSLFLFGVSLC